MFGGIVAIPSPPKETPDQPQKSEQNKRNSPSYEPNEKHDERWRQRAAESSPHEKDTVRIADLSSWEPSGVAAGCRGKRASLAHSEKQARQHQRTEIPC